VNARDRDGNTALDLARKGTYGDTTTRVKLLEAAMKAKKGVEERPSKPAAARRTSRTELAELPAEDRILEGEQRKRLRITWDKPEYGRQVDDKDGTRAPYLQVNGKLSLLQLDGKTLKPVDWPYPVRVVMTRRPNEKPDWSRSHDARDCVWADTLVGREVLHGDQGTADGKEKPPSLSRLPDGVFSVKLRLDEIESPVGDTKPFQVGLSFGEKKGKKLTWSNIAPILPQSVTMLQVAGPKPLSRTLQLINGCPTPFDGCDNHDPIALVRAVNHLRSLGKDKAIAELRAFLEVAYHSGDTEQTRYRIDPRNIDTSDRACLMSLVPLVFDGLDRDVEEIKVWQGIPFSFLEVSGTGGWVWGTEALVGDAADRGKLRAKPLRPADNPLQAADSLFSKMVPAEERKRAYLSQVHLRVQAWRSIRHLVDPDGKQLPDFSSQASWDRLKARVKQMKIRWDEERQEYVAGEKGK
jgi:hypothetical protein